jgi:hypothetical protein
MLYSSLVPGSCCARVSVVDIQLDARPTSANIWLTSRLSERQADQNADRTLAPGGVSLPDRGSVAELILNPSIVRRRRHLQ